MNLSIVKKVSCVFLLLLQCFVWQSAEAQPIQYLPHNTEADIANKTIDTNLPVGAINGAASVNDNGGASYSIPIAVPPGTNDVAPEISLSYNSFLGDGVMGRGWSIDGLSAITRDGQSFHFDGKKTPMNLSESDRFFLDGTRLTRRSGEYGSDASTYRKELDDYSIITSYGNMNGSPTWFKVEMKNGTVMEYGNRSDARFLNQDNTEPLIWRLNRISYPDGNYIEFYWISYHRDNRIHEIKYTGNTVTGQAPYNVMKFHYKFRNDQNTIYQAGSNIRSRFLLDRVEIEAEGSTFKTYELRYSYDNYRSTLHSIKEKGSDGSEMNNTIFKYGDQPLNAETRTLPTFLNQNMDLFSGDFDGDGYTDILGSPYTYLNGVKFNTGLKVYKRTHVNDNYFLSFQQSLPSESTVVNGLNIPKFHNFISSDFNGDGRDDIMTTKVEISGLLNTRRLVHLTLYKSTGNGFSTSIYTPPVGFNGVYPNYRYFFPGDFNGDGKTDFILFLSDGTGFLPFITLGGTNIQNRRIYNLGPGGYAGSSWVTADDVRVLDFDGDGKMELMKVDENNTKIYTLNWNGYSMWGELLYDEGFPTKAHRIYMGDFNGDQKTDMLVRNSQTSNSGTWEKAISTGQGFVTTPFLFNRTPDITDDPNDDQLEIGDFNGDGKTDIAHGWNYTQGSEIGMYYSRGDDFAYETMNYGFKLFFKALGQYDFDGDGRADIMNYSQPNLLARTLHFKRGGQELLLQNVVDGHLKRTNFSYRRMTESTNFYSRTSLGGYPQNVVQAPIYLTQQMQQDNGIGGFMTKQYEYVDAYIHRAGKGFLGFREMHTIDLTNDVRTELVRNQTLGIYLLAPYRLKKYVHSTGYLFNQFDYSTSFIARSNECYWLRVNGTTEHLYLEGQTKRMDYTYDTYGNITQEIEDNGVETITTNTTFGQYAGTVPNRPTEATITRQRVGQPAHTFTDRYTYNAKGQLLVRSDYLGLPKQANISFLYNDLGNVIREMRTASGLSLRTIVKSYDSKGRFVVSQVNPMGYTEYATYDPLWGTKTSVTGLDGLTTSFEYDVFGRRTKTTLPTAVVINEIYNFDVNSSYGSIYHHQVNQIGKPDQWFYFDRLGRKVRHHRKSHADAMVYEAWTYDSKGRPKTARAPYKSGESTFTTTYNYDNYNRRISEANPFGTTTYSYSYAGGIAKITKTNPAGQVSTVEMDASGMKTRATDNGGALDYIYDSQGLIHQVKLGGITMVTVLHDVYGNKVRIEDKNSGTLRYDYNAFKELIAETNANGHTYRMTYNKMSQMTRRYGPEEDYRYIYNSSGVERSKLSYVYNILSVYRKDLSYDSFGRVSRTNERIDGPFFTTDYTYNAYSDIVTKRYPSGLGLEYFYDSNGFLSYIKEMGDSRILFTNQGMNGREQYTSYKLVNGVTTEVSYNQGIPTRYLADGQQNLAMVWDYASGNLLQRRDGIKGRDEYFSYDNLNRLQSAQVDGLTAKDLTYFSNGNIRSKTDVGDYGYPLDRNNAVDRVTNTSNAIPAMTQDIRFAPFDQPSEVIEGDFDLTYSYGPDRQRTKSVLREGGDLMTTRYYLGDFERQIHRGAARDIHYINAGQGTVGMVVEHKGTFEFYATYIDHLGSILRVTDENGDAVAEQNFDAWGRKRNATTWEYTDVDLVPEWLYRGYTGHEHMPDFRLINMNGRMYDPLVGRMLSPDNHVQSPNNTQSYNRYSYVFNNPLSYTDPNGELAWFIPVIIGAVVGAYAGASIASGGQWNFTKWTKDAWKGAIVGAFVGAAAGAMVSAALPSMGVKVAGMKTAKGLTTAFKITTSAIKGANIKMAVTALTGGDLDKLYKSALAGAVLGGYKGAFKATGAFGLAEDASKINWKISLINKALYSTVESMAGNWIKGKSLTSNIALTVGPLRFSFSEKHKGAVWRWQDNVETLLPSAVSLLDYATGGEFGTDAKKLTLAIASGDWFPKISPYGKVNGAVFSDGSDWAAFIGQYFSKLK